jgi:Tfp pilus assembly protein PilF
VSVINQMLQELDRRNATPGTEGEQPPQQVKAVARPGTGHEWFWRTVAALLFAAVAWVAWVAYQLQPWPPLATEQAYKAAENAKKGAIKVAAKPPPAPPAAPSPSASSETQVPQPAPVETLRLAQTLQTPVAERPATAPRPDPAPPPKPEAPAPRKAEPKAAKPLVAKRERAKPGSELAEAQFRRAALLLNQGRVSEAEEQLVGALHADPGHVTARQAYVALLLEQQRTDAARRVLADALAVDPSHPIFALALARILAEQRDYGGALEVMDRAGSVARNADFLALRGAVFQRMQRHPEAIEAYQASVRGAPQPGTTWVGYGISLEAVGKRSDAAQAYRRSLGAGGLTREVREYAEARIRALE